MDSTTQATQIYRLIKNNNAAGTPNYKLAQLSLKYSSRISELRRDGHDIYCERVFKNGRATSTYLYYLREEQTKPTLKQKLAKALHV